MGSDQVKRQKQVTEWKKASQAPKLKPSWVEHLETLCEPCCAWFFDPVNDEVQLCPTGLDAYKKEPL